MTKNPTSLRDLLKNADEGYAMSVFSETKFDKDDIVKQRVGGFKKKNDYLYVWWHKGKWSCVDGKLKELSKYFIVDEIGYKQLTGDPLDQKVMRKLGLPREVDAASEIFFQRRWSEKTHASYRSSVKVYLNTQKKNHAQEIYQCLHDFIIDSGARAVASEFTTGKLSTIADMIAVRDEAIEVFEIKSKADTFKRLEAQITDYKTYADKVWVVIDKSLEQKLGKWRDKHSDLFSGVGVIIYSKGNVVVSEHAEINFPSTNYMDMLWQVEMEKVLVNLGLPYSSVTKDGTRRDRIEKICLHIQDRINKIGKEVLKSRIGKFYNGKHPKNPSMKLADCAGTISQYKLHYVVYGKSMKEQHKAEYFQELPSCAR
jgi:hypothetical protein